VNLYGAIGINRGARSNTAIGRNLACSAWHNSTSLFLLIEQFHLRLPAPTMTSPSSRRAKKRKNGPRMESRKRSKSKNNGLLSAAGASASGAAERLQSARIAAGSTASPHVDPPSGRAAGPSTEAPDLNDENFIRLGIRQPQLGGTKRYVEKSEEIILEHKHDDFGTVYRLIRQHFSDATFWKKPKGKPWRHATDSEIERSVRNRCGFVKRKAKRQEEERLASASLTEDQIPMLSEVPSVEDRNSKSSNSRSEQVTGLSEHQEIEDKSDSEPSVMLLQDAPTVQDNQQNNGSDLEGFTSASTVPAVAEVITSTLTGATAAAPSPEAAAVAAAATAAASAMVSAGSAATAAASLVASGTLSEAARIMSMAAAMAKAASAMASAVATAADV
jgi:hypothetical protein